MKDSKPSAVLFDFDGTIAQTLRLITYIPEEIIKLTALKEITEFEIQYLRKHGLRKFIQMLRISPFHIPKLLTELQSLFSRHLAAVPLVEGIPEVLEVLRSKQITVGIVTSNTRENVVAYLEHHQLSTVSFVYADKSIFGKHRVINRALRDHKINSLDSLYIGDEVRDVEAAKKSGMKSVAVSWGFSHRENLEKAQPNWLFDTPKELLALFEI